MSVVKAYDDGGDEITMFEHEGLNFSDVNTDSIINIRKLPIRDDDVFVCTFPRSGTHWAWETTRNLIAGHLLADPLEMIDCQMEHTPHGQINALPSPRVLNSHFRPYRLSPDIMKKGCKIVHVIRNPKDSVVSYYNFKINQSFYRYQGKWENYMKPAYLGKFNNGSWFDHLLAWEEVKATYKNILTLYYEDVIEDPLREIRKLDKFLETGRSEEFLTSLCDYLSFSKMKDRNQARSFLKKAYRKGKVGDWKNWFTVAQNEWFDNLYSGRMKGLGIKIRFTL